MSTGNLSGAEPAAPYGAGLRVSGGNGAGSSASEIRHAMRDGQAVVTFRTTSTDAATKVECEVRTVSDLLAPPQIIGPYSFASPAEARSFGDELMLALEYLGCELVDGDR